MLQLNEAIINRYTVSSKTVQDIVDCWRCSPNEETLLNVVYKCIPGKADIALTSSTLDVLCELFDFSNVLIYEWVKEVYVPYISDDIIRQGMLINDEGAQNAIKRSITKADAIYKTLLDMRFAIMNVMSYYRITSADWEFIMNMDISDNYRKLYILMYGFQEQGKPTFSLSDYRRDAQKLYDKVVKYVPDMLTAKLSPTYMLDQSIELSTCGKILELIHNVLVQTGEKCGENKLVLRGNDCGVMATTSPSLSTNPSLERYKEGE